MTLILKTINGSGSQLKENSIFFFAVSMLIMMIFTDFFTFSRKWTLKAYPTPSTSTQSSRISRQLCYLRQTMGTRPIKSKRRTYNCLRALVCTPQQWLHLLSQRMIKYQRKNLSKISKLKSCKSSLRWLPIPLHAQRMTRAATSARSFLSTSLEMRLLTSCKINNPKHSQSQRNSPAGSCYR